MSSMSLQGQPLVARHEPGVREYFAYFDERGTHDSPPVIVVGGLLGSSDQFVSLRDRLEALRDQYGFKIFHAVEYRNGKGEFKAWKPEKKLGLAVAFRVCLESVVRRARLRRRMMAEAA